MSAGHTRNTRAMRRAALRRRERAKGTTCRAPAMHGKIRCRMHGGAPGSGAPRGNRNAQKHGAFTLERTAERRAIRELLGEARKLLKELDAD